MKQPAATLRWARMRHGVARLRVPGWIGLAALLAAGPVALLALGPMTSANGLRAAELESTRQLLAARRSGGDVPRPVESAQSLIDALPASEQMPRFVQVVQEDAQRRGLQIESVEYKVETLPGAKVQRYQVLLPMRGDYRAMRAWLDATLGEYPSVALDEFAVRRDADGGASLNARIALSYFMRTAP